MKPRRRWRRALVLLPAALLLLELIYLVAGNVAINSAWLAERLNRRPERVQVTWDHGVTYYPGHCRLENVRVVGQLRRSQYEVTFSHGTFSVSLWRLARRHVHVRRGHAADLDVRVRKRLDAADIPAEKAAHFPPIEGLANPPERKPEDLYPARGTRPPWTISVGRFTAEGLRQVWIHDLRLEWNGDVTAGFTMVVRDRLEVPRAQVRTSGARITLGPDVLAENLDLAADISMEPYRYREVKGLKLFRTISGDIALTSRFGGLGFINDHGSNLAGMDFSGHGSVKADLHLEQGRMLPGSTYDVDADSVDVSFLGYRFSSAGTIASRTDRPGKETQERLAISLGQLTGERQGHGDVTLSAPGLSFTAVTGNPLLVGSSELRSLEVELPNVVIPQIAVFNDLLPDVLELQFLDGEAIIDAAYSIDDGGAAGGYLHLQGGGIRAVSEAGTIRGNLGLDARYSSADFSAPTYNFHDTTLAVDGVHMEEAPEGRKRPRKKDADPWWGQVTIHEAALDLTDGRNISGDAGFSMLDIAPLIYLLQEEGQSPGWFSLIPNVKEIDGRARVAMEPGHLDIPELDVTGKGLLVKGRLRNIDTVKRGAFYVKYKGFALAVALDDTEAKKKARKRWTMRKPLHWYEEKVAELLPAEAGGAP